MDISGNCNICGGTLAIKFGEARDPLTGDTFTVSSCERCGLGHTLPQPDDLSPYYPASAYYGNRHGFTARRCSRRRIGIVRGSGAAKGRILDIGCGDGSFLLEARKAGWEVTGTELNPAMARELGLDVREGLELIGDGERFDCITMWHTLEHMTDIPSILKRAAMLLNADGRMIVAVPDWGGVQATMFRERWLHLDVPRHLYHFGRKSLERSLGTAGLVPVKYRHMELEYDLMGWTQSVLNWITPWPNLFFDTLTGKGAGAGALKRGAVFIIGSLVTLAALPAVALEAMLRRGGTLIAVAKKKPAAQLHMQTTAVDG